MNNNYAAEMAAQAAEAEAAAYANAMEIEQSNAAAEEEARQAGYAAEIETTVIKPPQPAEVPAKQLAEDTDQDLLLETAWMARETELILIDQNKMIRGEMEMSEKYLAAQQTIQECEADLAESVKELNSRIDSLRDLQVACLERAQELSILSKVTTAGTYKVVQKTVRTVIPEKFREIHGDELFNQLAEIKIKVTEADKIVGKASMEGCVAKTPQGSPKIDFIVSKTKTGVLTGKKGVKA